MCLKVLVLTAVLSVVLEKGRVPGLEEMANSDDEAGTNNGTNNGGNVGANVGLIDIILQIWRKIRNWPNEICIKIPVVYLKFLGFSTISKSPPHLECTILIRLTLPLDTGNAETNTENRVVQAELPWWKTGHGIRKKWHKMVRHCVL
jgi:hypothetical protein